MKANAKRLIAGILIIAALALVVFRGDSLITLIETVQRASLLPLLLAVLFQMCKYSSQAFAYSFCFQAVGETMKVRDCFLLVFGSFFMNTLAPSLNLAGMTLVVDDARRKGIEPGKSSSAALLMQIGIDGAFAVVLLLGFIYILLAGELPLIWFTPGLVVLALVLLMIFLLVAASKNSSILLTLITKIELLQSRIWLRIFKKTSKPWAERTVALFSESAQLISKNPKLVLKVFLCTFFASVCELTAFAFVGFSFGISSLSALVCGYLVATLFAMVSLTPQGVGFVEAAVALVFVQLGESPAVGTAVGIVYRGIVFWLPFLLGALVMRKLSLFSKREDTQVIPE